MDVLWLWIIYLLTLIISYAILSSISLCSSWSNGIIFLAATLIGALVVFFIYLYTDKSIYKDKHLFWYNALLILALILPVIAIIYIILSKKYNDTGESKNTSRSKVESHFKKYMKYNNKTGEYILIKETIYEGNNETTIEYEQ